MKGDMVSAQSCNACLLPIYDQYSYRIDPNLHYHWSCLSCSECHRPLANDSRCCTRDGRLYCRMDYERLFAVRCAGCDGILWKSDYVIRTKTRTYHPDCFRCCACARVLSIGEQCVLHDEEPFCRADSDLLSRHASSAHTDAILTPSEYEARVARDATHNGTLDEVGSATLRDATNKQLSLAGDRCCSPPDSSASPTSMEHAACFPDSPCSQTDSSEFSALKSASRQSANARRCAPVAVIKSNKKSRKAYMAHEKSSRIRTVLTEKQLHTLRACYAANPRPDALMKDQLVEMTGLSPRVIRVWFQNKRCKDKKRNVLLKQLREQDQNGARRSELLYATPLIASTPIIYDAASTDCSVDIQPYCYAMTNAAC